MRRLASKVERELEGKEKDSAYSKALHRENMGGEEDEDRAEEMEFSSVFREDDKGASSKNP